MAFTAHGLVLREYAFAPAALPAIFPPVKRFVWLLLAAFCTALAQVQPVDLPATKHEVCNCCEQPGACGLPDCSLPPALPQPVQSLQAPVQVARVAAPLPRNVGRVSYVLLAPRPATAPAWDPSLLVTAPAGVSLFQEHCSLLL
jgi:hypothetical protein